MSVDTQLSRSGTTSPFGKNDRRLDIPISEELESAIIAMAAIRGVPKSEYARQIIERALFGDFSMMQKIANRSD